MVDNNLDMPSWLNIAVSGAIALISGLVGAASTAVLIALGIAKKFAEMEKNLIKEIISLRLHVDASDSKRFHDMIGIVQQEVGKSETADDELGRRIGACEQDIAVMKDFKRRMEKD